MLTKWSEELLTGNEIIDAQHKEIFDRAAKMVDSGKNGKSKQEAIKIVEYLEGYYRRHFAAEEALQMKYEYPEREAHEEIHKQFHMELTQIKQKLVVSGVDYALALETIIFMLRWLAEHINKSDRQLAAYIRNMHSGKPMPISRFVR